MLEHELVADGDDRRPPEAREGVERGHRLEEIKDHVRLRFSDDGVELAEDAEVFRQVAEHAEQRGGVADGTAVLVFELKRRQLADGRLHRRCEVCRHGPLGAGPERHGHDLMARRLGHFLHRHRLGHVAPALAQHAEHHFHGSG